MFCAIWKFSLEDIQNENEDDEEFDNEMKKSPMQFGSNDFEMSGSTSDDLDEQITDTTMSSFLKKCDTTSSPTSSTPIPLPTTPPLILSNSTTHQEIVYNNNGYSIKSSVNEYTNYNAGPNGSTKVIVVYQKI